MNYRHKVKCSSKVCEIKKHIDNELKEFSKLLDDEELIFEIRLVLNELLINACEHGNKWDAEKCVDYEIIINKDYIKITVQDEGDGLREIEPYNAKSLESSGRGIKIVKELTDDLVLENNKVIAIINL